MVNSTELLGEFEPDPKASLPFMLFVSLFVAFVIGGIVVVGGFVMGVFLLDAGMITPPVLYAIVAVGIVVPVAIVVGIPLWGYKEVATVRYRIYEDRIEEAGGWIKSGEKTVPVDEITDVKYKKGIVGGVLNVGTVKVSTAGTDGTSLSLNSLEEGEDLFRDVQALTENDGETGPHRQDFRVLSSPTGW